jgi:hypothetical protein
MSMSVAEAARSREAEAWDQRYKHGKAARIWAAIVEEKPDTAEVSRILARWMSAYEAADAAAEREFRELAAKATP